MADKQELWLATDGNGTSLIYRSDPEWNEKAEQFQSDDNSMPVYGTNLPPGHKARLTIGEAVDCRPKPVNVPEIWLYRLNRAWFYGNKHEQMMSIKEPEGVELPIKHKCRVAIDESGIRLIGTPERV